MTYTSSYKYFTEQLINIYDRREAANIAHIVFEEYTGITKTQNLINDKELNEAEQNKINHALTLLLQHKPLQQILGYEYFFGNKFYVNEHVLIPRPETEQLIQWVIEETKDRQGLSILDIGTGSGCIPVSLKLHIPDAAITSIDISNDALQTAQQNALQLKVDINLLQLDFLDETQWQQLGSYDIIVSNPPYISHEEKKDMRQNVLDYEPHIALFTPNNDALVFYKKIAAFAKNYLQTNGKIYCELNEHLSSETAEIFTNKGFQVVIKKDFQQKDRMLKAFINE